MNYRGKIDLNKLGKTALIKGKQGQQCLMIDISESNLFFSEKTNAVYLDITCWEQNNEYGSHSIKQSFSKQKQEELKKLEKEERYQKDPILGSLMVIAGSVTPSATPVPIQQDDAYDISDDLPF